MLRPEKDRYGPEADRSNLADYLELLALDGSPMSRGDLADFLRDANWTVRSRELYVNAGGPEPEPGEDLQDGGVEMTPQERWAEEVFTICEARGTFLGSRYPFSTGEDRLECRPFVCAHRAYLALLSITVAHHYELPTASSEAPERVFEELIGQVFENRGLLTCNLGALGRTGLNFRDRVLAAGHKIAVSATPEAAISRTHANDEKVDTISNLAWGDQRGGHWLYIGQATVGDSSTWQAKMMQPRPHQWQDLMSSVIVPTPYLAVPHHVEDAQLADLVRGDHRLVLDRMRIARYLRTITAGAGALIQKMRAEEPYDPR